ncbi:MAG: hypothetical protein E4G94_11615 [ANME-2 cluster archaeon]|nr:MAG: hypothetical protein E4G94_11615 [ANME-2 cluster archaeon]
MKRTVFIICIFTLTTTTSFSQQSEFLKLSGPYLGQTPPGMTPENFASGIISTKEDETAFEISSSGKEIVFIRKNRVMIMTMKSDGSWNKPAVAPFSGNSIDDESCFSPDGNEIYFISRRNCPGSKYGANLWVTKKIAGKWTEPEPVQITVNTKQFHAPSIASNGNLYDTGIIKFNYENGNYLSVQELTPLLQGMSPFVAPDESYLIFSKRLPNHSPDLYITFKNKEGKWTNPIPLGDKINSPTMEGNSFVTSDGKYLFFTRAFDIYWVDAKIIEDLKPKELK